VNHREGQDGTASDPGEPRFRLQARPLTELEWRWAETSNPEGFKGVTNSMKLGSAAHHSWRMRPIPHRIITKSERCFTWNT